MWAVETGNENVTACFIVCSLFMNIIIYRMLCFEKIVSCLIPSSHIQRHQSFSERSGSRNILLESLPNKQSSGSFS